MAASLYWKDFQKLNEQTAGKFTLENELFIWQKILRENIFIEVKTPKGKRRADQVRFAKNLRDMCAIYGVARSAEEAVTIVRDELKVLEDKR